MTLARVLLVCVTIASAAVIVAMADTPSGAVCGNTGDGYHSFSATNPKIVGGANANLNTFFMDPAICIPMSAASDPVFGAGSSSESGACTLKDITAFRTFFSGGNIIQVQFGNGPVASCSCKAVVPSGGDVNGATLTVQAESDGDTSYPWACSLKFTTPSNGLALRLYDTFSFTYVAETSDVGGGNASTSGINSYLPFIELVVGGILCFIAIAAGSAYFMRKAKEHEKNAREGQPNVFNDDAAATASIDAAATAVSMPVADTPAAAQATTSLVAASSKQ